MIELKNYPALCSLLGLPVKTGASKRKQLAEIRQSYNLQQVPGTHKYIITETYPQKHPKPDGRAQGNHSVYAPLIKPLLPSGLQTKNRIMKATGLANDLYFECLSKGRELNLQIYNPAWNKDQVNYAMRLIKERAFRIIDRSLTTLQKRGEIKCEKKYVAIDRDGERFIVEDEAELETIHRCEREEHGSFYDMERYYSQVRKRLHDEYGWRAYYSAYEIVSEGRGDQDTMAELNQRFQKSLITTIRKNYEANKERFPRLYGPNFCVTQRELVRFFTTLHPDITDLIIDDGELFI